MDRHKLLAHALPLHNVGRPRTAGARPGPSRMKRDAKAYRQAIRIACLVVEPPPGAPCPRCTEYPPALARAQHRCRIVRGTTLRALRSAARPLPDPPVADRSACVHATQCSRTRHAARPRTRRQPSYPRRLRAAGAVRARSSEAAKPPDAVAIHDVVQRLRDPCSVHAGERTA